MRELFLFFSRKSAEFRFRRKAAQVGNRGAGTNDILSGRRSNSPSLQTPLAAPPRRRPPILVATSGRLAQH